MHDCPDCGMACDCDGEDTWHDWDSQEVSECCCDCFDDGEDYYDDEYDGVIT